MTLIPKDLLSDLPDAPPGALRLYVTLWALAVDDHTPRWDVEHWRAVRQRVRGVWPLERLRRRGRLTVVSILLELEELGAVRGVERTADGFAFQVCGEEQAA